MNLELKKFDMKNIKYKSSETQGPVIVLIGRRDTGKSFLVKDLLYHHQDIPIGTVISGTEAGNGFYSKMVPKLFIHDEYNTAIIENILKRQKMVIKQINKEVAAYGRSNIDGRAFVILDDCLYDNSWQKDKNIRNIFMNGRHYNILFILTMQFALGIPPNLRTNIDYVFILRENIVSNRKRIYDHYAGMFPTFDMFCSTMDQCTENFECLVICNNAKSNKIEDQVFWYKAESHPEFRMGPDDVWDYSNSNYTADKNSDDDVDINNYTKNRGVSLKIDKLDDYNY